ncbi:MAG: hypothetical protein LBF97_01290 [Elusimicrobiota bacterium]|jgi:hypothetical protein|nr:hypothetical protein [Elusimicrobiota bacterium]
MNFENFKRGICIISISASVDVTEEQLQIIFEILKTQDIDDAEFLEACKLIALHEKFYNKLPEPVVFCDYALKVRERKAEERDRLASRSVKLAAPEPTESARIRKMYERCAVLYKAYRTPAYQKIRGIKSEEEIPEKLREIFKELPLEGIKKIGLRLNGSDRREQQQSFKI